MPAPESVTVQFEPGAITVAVPAGTLVSEALRQAGITLPLDCGGHGSCGRCRVTARGGLSAPDHAEQRLLGNDALAQDRRLACRVRLEGPARVWLPPVAELGRQGWPMEADALEDVDLALPVIQGLPCAPPAPSLADHRSDLGRILATLPGGGESSAWRAGYRLARQASQMARAQGWDLCVFVRDREIVGLSGRGEHPLGVAVDLGSTKLALYLVDLATGELLGARGRLNPQVVYGADVITRLHQAMTNPDHARRLARLAREAVGGLMEALVGEAGLRADQVAEICLVGNTAMIHLWLELPVGQLAATPFVASWEGSWEIKARELALPAAPEAHVHIPPLMGGFVGADNLAMILACDLDQGPRRRLGLDIGTNTEIVLSLPHAEHRLYVASAPSGPTFEGAHLSAGMRAMAGAINQVELRGEELLLRVIGEGPALGICGSGVIDALAAMRRLGLMDRRGRLHPDHPRLSGAGATRRLVLAPETQGRGEVAITQADISQVQLAKAAIMAGVQTLCAVAQVAEAVIEEVVLAGSFGSHFDLDSARLIGLIPDVPGAALSQVGNAALRGARRLVLSQAERKRAAGLPGLAHYVELSNLPVFKALFARNLTFPPLAGD